MPVPRYIPVPFLATSAPHNNFNISDMFPEDPIATSILFAIPFLILLAFTTSLVHRAVTIRRRGLRWRLARLEANAPAGMQGDLETLWDGRDAGSDYAASDSASSTWEEVFHGPKITVMAKKWCRSPRAARRVSHLEFENSDGEGFEFVPAYLRQE
ncbi:hypothetical protein DOTSEDRAFT_29434 [Dothistroma septosporum NZE10]|uniref:Uncharacterized protein n=1 Tax=Dothistroma septosporum (strain NZE10 / CBS 128990) TaxID=675120 RepID=N1PD68_DOTSN|nr:hypothetical protein DOTSEDRAFT_29434 [Dothistroma septosporum NZE10]